MKKSMNILWYGLWLLTAPPSLCLGAESPQALSVNTQETLTRLLTEADTVPDKKITIDDHPNPFILRSIDGHSLEVKGHYHLANLLQELKLAELRKQTVARIERTMIFEPAEERISRSIRELYWQGLTRRVDLENLPQILVDPKIATQSKQYVYVPAGDAVGRAYFSRGPYTIKTVPRKLTLEFVKSLAGKHGPLVLGLEKDHTGKLRGIPFVVPGGRFNEMYGWDSYFEALGLLEDGRTDLAKAMVDNFVYQIQHYGKILNANRSYYLTRSQPPFLTTMILAVYKALPQTKAAKYWLKKSVRAAVREYEHVWMGKEHLTPTGLSRYFGWSVGIPPEVEPGHYAAILEPYAQRHKMSVTKFESVYRKGQLKEPELDTFFVHDQAVRESGHDTTYRWRIDSKDQCANFVTVDLNALLYKYEIDLAEIYKDEFNNLKESQKWAARAEQRKELILKYLWDPEREMFFDYDYLHKRRHRYISATALYPLWAWNPKNPETQILAPDKAQRSVKKLLAELEMPGGLAATSPASLKEFGDADHLRQWDYPNGWAPHQIIAWQALANYDLNEDRRRLAHKWISMITQNATDYNGTIPEKFDVVKRSHRVFAEYGNVGTEFSYITQEGFGWMNASYQLGRKILLTQPKTTE